MSFLVYDLILLGIFLVLIGSFIYRRRKRIQKEGLLLLYRTSWGIKLIDYVGEKYPKTLQTLSYVSIGLGYLLMIGVFYLIYTVFKIYAIYPEVVRAIKVPPITPLIPYLPQVFKLDFLPPFYFTYWIIILAIIAITHEFAHGIFAAHNKIKIKKTGFGFFPFFLPVFLAAFVELDEKVMATKKKISQMAILSAGTFANVLTAIFFLIILGGFFSLSFSPAGVMFDDYTYSVVGVEEITSIKGVALANPSYDQLIEFVDNSKFNDFKVGEKSYLGIKGFSQDLSLVALYDNSPAINAGLMGAIIKINENKVKSMEDLNLEIIKYSPGEEIVITTILGEETKEYEIILDENPLEKGKPWIGIGFSDQKNSGLMGIIFSTIASFKKPHIYYEPVLGEFSWFIYNLLWWLILISISVALINMLPAGIFDGGRFFYLTIWGLTKSESKAKKLFVFFTYFFLLILLLLMFFWVKSFF